MRTLEEEMHLAREAKRQPAKKKRRPEPGVEKSLRYNLWEGGFFGAMTGLTLNFLAPFALIFQASNLFISLITTLPNLVGSFFQLGAPKLVQLIKSQRRYLVLFLGVQGILWLAIGLLGFLPGESALPLLLLLSIGASTCALLTSPVWMSYMGNLVPERQRNRYFSKRNMVTGILTFLATIFAGVILFLFTDNPAIGFLILFVVAALARWGSTWCFHRSRDYPADEEEQRPFNVLSFIQRAPTSDFGRFVSLAVLIRLATYIAYPFFIVYLLHVLNYSYFLFTMVQLGTTVSGFLSLHFWAELAERRGNRSVLLYSSLLISLIPFLWVTTGAFAAMLLFQLISGASWAGFNYASNNYMLEATSRKTRARAISHFNLFNNLAIFVGGLLGSGLLGIAEWITGGGALPFLLLFATSGVARLVAALSARPKLRELRLVGVLLKRGASAQIVNILPGAGNSYLSVDYLTERVHDSLRSRFRAEQDFSHLRRVGKGRDVSARMSARERELYRQQFVDRVRKR